MLANASPIPKPTHRVVGVLDRFMQGIRIGIARDEQNQDLSMRRLPGPAESGRGDEGDFRGSLFYVSGLAENPNSIFCNGFNRA